MGERRRVVAEQQREVELVQLVVVGERLAVEAADERQEVLQVPVRHVGHVEADQAEDHQHDPVAGPVLAHQHRRLRLELRRLEPRAPQRARDDVDREGQQHEKRQAHPGGAEEPVGIAERIAQRDRGDDRQRAHDDGVADHECVGMPFHEMESRRRRRLDSSVTRVARVLSRRPSTASRTGVHGQPHLLPDREVGAGVGDGLDVTDALDADGEPELVGGHPRGEHGRGDRRRPRRPAAPSVAARPPARRRRRRLPRPAAPRRRRTTTVGYPRNTAVSRVGRVPPDLIERARLDEPPGPHHGHPVGDRERLLVVVGDQQRRGVCPAQDVAELAGQVLAQRRVEGAERLVEQQQPRLDGQGPGEGDALPLAAGERRRHPVAVRRAVRPGRAGRPPAPRLCCRPACRSRSG